jgi:hypothetical protein
MKYSFLLLILLLPAELYGQHRFEIPGMSQSETRAVDASRWRPFDSETIAVQTAFEVGVVGLGMGAAWIVNENTSAQNSASVLPILLITPWLIPAAAYYGGEYDGRGRHCWWRRDRFIRWGSGAHPRRYLNWEHQRQVLSGFCHRLHTCRTDRRLSSQRIHSYRE